MHGRTIIKEMLQHDFYVYYIGSQQTDAVATSSPKCEFTAFTKRLLEND